MREALKSAARSKDISSIVRFIVRSSSLSPSEYINRTMGSLMFTYYMFVDNLHRNPSDLDDLVDGMLYLDGKNYMQKQSLAKGRI